MGLVAATYPAKAWHLAYYQGIILKARKMAGDSVALAYDEDSMRGLLKTPRCGGTLRTVIFGSK